MEVGSDAGSHHGSGLKAPVRTKNKQRKQRMLSFNAICMMFCFIMLLKDFPIAFVMHLHLSQSLQKRNKCMQEYSCFPLLSGILDIYMQEYLHLAH